MKILSNTNLWNLQTALDLTPLCDSSILQIDEDTFAFVALGKKEPYLVIQSEIFSLLLQRIEGQIVSINVYRPQCLSCDGEGLLMIRLCEDDQCIYQITEDDGIEICMSLEALYNKRNETKPV